MKKKIALLVACLFLMSSAALAAPLTNYKAGKASIDLNYRSTKNTIEDWRFDRKFNLEPSITVGIADKWALQYRNVNAKSKSTSLFYDPQKGSIDITGKLSVNEFNVLYSLTPKVSAFAGYVGVKGTFGTTISTVGFGSVSDSESAKKNTWQLGLLGSVPITDKFSAYGVLGAGSKWTNFEIGVAYAFTKNWELNVDYRHMKAKDLDGADVKAKGVGFGVTYKFQ